MTTEYKNLYYDLKYRYEANIRLLRTYKSLHQSFFKKPNALDDLNKKQIKINNITRQELSTLIRTTEDDLRNLHLIRAFIRNVPYKKVEAKTNRESAVDYGIQVKLDNFVGKFYKKLSSKDRDNILNEYENWVTKGESSKFFAKPEKTAPAHSELVISVDANGSYVETVG